MLGSGSFGAVVEATDLELDRRVAVKMLAFSLEETQARERFEREARVTAGLNHPNVVTVYDHGIEGEGIPFIVYQLLPGEDMDSILEREGRLSAERVADWGVQIADALATAHAAGVVHRDVKPGNVMVTEGDRPVLCDFGLAWRPSGETVLTQEGIVLGTPAFLAPELWTGSEPSPASDQFGWAASLHLMLTGEGVYPDADVQDIFRFLHDGRPIGRFPDGVRRTPLEAAIQRGLSRDPARRYPDLRAFAAALRGERESPPEVTRVVQPPPPRSRFPVIAALSIGACLLWGLLPGEPAPSPPPTPPAPPVTEPAGPRLVDEQRERLRRVMKEAPGFERQEGRSEAHVLAKRADLLDPRLPLAWKRYLDALEVEARAGWGRSLTPDEESAFRFDRTVVIHVLADLEVLDELGSSPLEVERLDPGANIRTLLTRIHTAHSAVSDPAREFADRLSALPPAQDLVRAEFLGSTVVRTKAEGLPDRVRDMLRLVKKTKDRSKRRVGMAQLLQIVGHRSARAQLPCGPRLAFLEELEPLLLDRDGFAGGKPGFMNLLDGSFQFVLAAVLCHDQRGEEDRVRLARILDEVDARAGSLRTGRHMKNWRARLDRRLAELQFPSLEIDHLRERVAEIVPN